MLLATYADCERRRGRQLVRILYHHRTLGDGAEGIHVAAIVNAFRALGHEVKVAAMVGEKTADCQSLIRIFERLRHWVPQALYETMEMGYSLAGYRLLMGNVNGWKPQFLYERYTLFNLSGVMVARRLKIPLIMEVNSPLAYERAQYERLGLQRTAQALERFVLTRADLVLAVSTPLKNYIIKRGVPSERVLVLPNGTDPTLFHPDTKTRQEIRRQSGIPLGTMLIGFVGILRPWHGIELLFDAIARIKNISHNLCLLIVGDGPSQSDLERLAREKGLGNNVIFVGRVAHQKVPGYLSTLDIAVSPRATFYASPMKVLEYMATGIPVVAPRMQNLQDVITDGFNGALFEAENSVNLAAVLSSLIQNESYRRKLGENARATILRGRTWTHNAEQILQLVERLN